MQRKPNCICKICGKPVYRRPSQQTSGNVYCSSICTGKDQQILKVCKICSRTYVGNKQTCSHACANTARTGVMYTRENRFNNAYRGSQLKERVASLRGGLCERCSEANYAILQIHHIVEQYRDGTDELTNLQLLCPNCHATHHLGTSLYNKEKVI